jgi:hypothetical protein
MAISGALGTASLLSPSVPVWPHQCPRAGGAFSYAAACSPIFPMFNGWMNTAP